MRLKKTPILPILLATIWISLSEFLRNEFLLKPMWTGHYEEMGLVFPSAPANGAVWGIWSLLLAILIYIISRKFTLWQTTFLGWLAAFFMMWVVIGNLDVLPYGILWYAIPLSLLEVFLAAWITKKLSK